MISIQGLHADAFRLSLPPFAPTRVYLIGHYYFLRFCLDALSVEAKNQDGQIEWFSRVMSQAKAIKQIDKFNKNNVISAV